MTKTTKKTSKSKAGIEPGVSVPAKHAISGHYMRVVIPHPVPVLDDKELTEQIL